MKNPIYPVRNKLLKSIAEFPAWISNGVKTIFDVMKKRELRTVPNCGTRTVPVFLVLYLAVMLNVMKHLKIGILRLRLRMTLILAILITSVPIVLHAGNLVPDGTFEDGNTTEWTTSLTCQYGATLSKYQSGNYSAFVTTESISAAARKWIDDDITVTAGYRYNFAGYVWNSVANANNYTCLCT